MVEKVQNSKFKAQNDNLKLKVNFKTNVLLFGRFVYWITFFLTRVKPWVTLNIFLIVYPERILKGLIKYEGCKD